MIAWSGAPTISSMRPFSSTRYTHGSSLRDPNQPAHSTRCTHSRLREADSLRIRSQMKSLTCRPRLAYGWPAVAAGRSGAAVALAAPRRARAFGAAGVPPAPAYDLEAPTAPPRPGRATPPHGRKARRAAGFGTRQAVRSDPQTCLHANRLAARPAARARGAYRLRRRMGGAAPHHLPQHPPLPSPAEGRRLGRSCGCHRPPERVR